MLLSSSGCDPFHGIFRCFFPCFSVRAEVTGARSRYRCLRPLSRRLTRLIPARFLCCVDLTNVNDRVLNVQETDSRQSRRDCAALSRSGFPARTRRRIAIANLAGLVVTANGKRIDWVRDRVNMYAFHIEVPQGATALDVSFQYLAPMDPKRRPHLVQVRRPDLE